MPDEKDKIELADDELDNASGGDSDNSFGRLINPDDDAEYEGGDIYVSAYFD